jgi:hypothetical protein
MMTSPTSSTGGKILRAAAIILFALAAFFNLMGGIGTACVALNPTRWSPAMAKLAPYQWLYILLMIGATGVAVWGVVVTIGLARGKRHAYRDALIVLALSALFAGIQTFVSIALRGKGAPQNMRFYITTFTLVAFLILRLPPIWKLIGGFQHGGGDAATTGGLAAFVGGLVVLTTLLWATPTHIGPDGANWVNVLRLPLLAGGSLLAFGGAALVWAANRRGHAVIAEEARAEGQPVAGR